MSAKPIVVVDDDIEHIETMLAMLRRVFLESATFGNAEIVGFTDPIEAIERVREDGASLVITDLTMPGLAGEDVVRLVQDIDPRIPLVVMTGHQSLDMAQEVTRLGVLDYLLKPVRGMDLYLRLHLALQRHEMSRTIEHLEEQLAGRPTEIVGSSRVMREVRTRVDAFRGSTAPVLIEGESGTGKELVARRIHWTSMLSGGPFVPVNCGALPETLIESELFGVVRGAFTGADRDKDGLVRRANGGTLFLDEVGELSHPVQVKLLRFLQEERIRPVGSSTEVEVSVRVIAATNRPLATLVARGEFRQDLYYRLRVLPIQLPALSQRGDDLEVLAILFMRQYVEKLGRWDLKLGTGALRTLREHSWPGNIRELQNVVHRLAILAEGPVVRDEEVRDAIGEILGPEPNRLPTARRQFAEERALLLSDFEAAYVADQLRRARGNVSRAARSSGMDRKSFWRIMERRGLKADDYRSR
jgi:DNA-binding NtrC family response regulator